MQYMMIVCISRKVAVDASQFGFKASKISFLLIRCDNVLNSNIFKSRNIKKIDFYVH